MSLAERVNTLFRLWRAENGAEQSNAEVAAAVAGSGGQLTPEALAAIRHGDLTAVSHVELSLLADHFTVDARYLTSQSGAGLHEQLVFLCELAGSGLKGIYLRGGAAPSDLRSISEIVRSSRRGCVARTSANVGT
ncbi:hypothetical protein CH253_18350 [Rhodococcus sp. 06-156-3C]|nr:hypothetical protein CH248_27550 [Rhodococcus sp. 06-156-4a]OZD17897.1 hypothetical protein CH253_18350 [Rhodococcus sp. 06-156-3C]OZD20622.1 hypothetical protein CH280_03505 [Rhodococcus sp. 06-156-4C]OZD32567.1 hypothetical protein CH284_20035 [Rhodococcus sp. 06-156-3]